MASAWCRCCYRARSAASAAACRIFWSTPVSGAPRDQEQPAHLTKLLAVHRRRLRVLELQAATFGTRTPPEVITEIEDIQQQMAALEVLLGCTEQLG